MNENRKNKLPVPVTNILVDDILESSDEEILNEAHEQYGDVNAESIKIESVINAAVLNSKKAKLAQARERLENHKATKMDTNVLSISISEKRKLIRHAKGLVKSLTLAARNEAEMSESDVDGILNDLIDLGVIDKDGNINKCND